MIAVDRLTYHYPDTNQPALRELNLEFSPGEVSLLLGGNGAGKSTLALALAGLIPHHYKGQMLGKVLLEGRSSRAGSPGSWVRQVGIVFSNPQDQFSYARQTVFEEVAFGLENRGVPRGEMISRVNAILEQLHLQPFADRPPTALSGGQQQKVALAAMLVLEPKVLVLDEPTASLDPASTDEAFKIIRGVAEEGRTVILASHRLEQAGAFAAKAVLLNQGCCLLEDRPKAVLSDPLLETGGLLRPTAVRLAEQLKLPLPWPVFLHESVPVFRSALELKIKRVERMPPERTCDLNLNQVEPTEVVIKEVSFEYSGGVQALKKANLQLKPGTLTALLGANGAGKTTLSKMINGLLRPDGGLVTVGNWNVADKHSWQLAQKVGYLFQNPDDQLFKSTVREEVAFGPGCLGRKGKQLEQAVERALEWTGLLKEAQLHPYDLQPNRRQWVAIASVLAMETPVMVFDEPTTGLDASELEKLKALLFALRAGGHTLLLMTHHMNFAAKVADRVALMAEGKVPACESAREIFSDKKLCDQAGIQQPAITPFAQQLGLGSQIIRKDDFWDAWERAV